jgi:SAM-dependent methyltransferase
MSTLKTVKDEWESLAERDALSAILTDKTKANGKWSIEDFMRTGRAEVETVIGHLEALNCTPDSSRAALDFGCGVGRLTQALARHFDSCIGVDISPSMIQKAVELNQYPHCRYIVHSDVRLPFADSSFSFIYSNIVLQHMPRQYSEGYIREFLRVLEPEGVLVFGVQDSFAIGDLSSLLTRIRDLFRLRSRIKTMLQIGHADMEMHCLPEYIVRRALGAARIVDIQLTNTAEKDFNGNLIYLQRAPAAGYISKQYCIVK